MGKLNAKWHAGHRMPTNAQLEQRVKWHIAHARACGCREIPATIVTVLKSRGTPVPRRRATD
jgi:hypothetical protein